MMEGAKLQSVIWFNSSKQPVLKCESGPPVDIINCTLVLVAIKEIQLSDSYTCKASSGFGDCTKKTIDLPIGKQDAYRVMS